jgi:hypothetical protein
LHGRFISAVGDRSTANAAEKEWDRMETGALSIVSVTPSLRGSYEDLRGDWEPLQDLHDLIAPPKPPPAPEDGPAPSEPVVEEEDGWELVDLKPYLTGTFKRPQPTFLRRTP